MKAISVLIGAALIAASCSNAANESALPSTLALQAETIPDPPRTTSETTTSTVPRTFPEYEAIDNYHTGHGAPDTTVAPTTTTTTAPAPAAPVNNGGGGTPAVTSSGGSPQAPSSLYKGLLGTYSLDQVFAPAAAPAPSTAAGTFPLTGRAGSAANRPAIVVKVDNSSKARPQSGLNQADIVFEEEVEYGITRLAAVFHSKDATVGPVRSGRSTDISFLNAFGRPGLVYSGANKVIDQLLLNQVNISNYSAARSSGYWRSSSRRAPSNLYTKTSSFSSIAPGGAPPAQFYYRPAGVSSTGGVASGEFRVNYPSNKVRWEWNGVGWVRYQGGSLHTTDGEPVNAANVVVVAVQSVATGLFDSTGAPVPEFVFVGTGDAVVYTDGRRIDGRWTRPTLRDPAIVHVNGNVIELTPGRTWVQIVSAGQFQG